MTNLLSFLVRAFSSEENIKQRTHAGLEPATTYSQSKYSTRWTNRSQFIFAVKTILWYVKESWVAVSQTGIGNQVAQPRHYHTILNIDTLATKALVDEQCRSIEDGTFPMKRTSYRQWGLLSRAWSSELGWSLPDLEEEFAPWFHVDGMVWPSASARWSEIWQAPT